MNESVQSSSFNKRRNFRCDESMPRIQPIFTVAVHEHYFVLDIRLKYSCQTVYAVQKHM